MFSWSLFNLQSAFRALSSSGFSGRSLECLYIITKPFPFVNTFFHFFCDFFQVLLSVFEKFRLLPIFPQIQYNLLKNCRFSTVCRSIFPEANPLKSSFFKKVVKKFLIFYSRRFQNSALTYRGGSVEPPRIINPIFRCQQTAVISYIR